MRRLNLGSILTLLGLVVAASPAGAETEPPQEFIAEAKALLVVGACAEGTAPVKAETYAAHCKKVRAAQDEYKKSWLTAANEFFRANVPAAIPKTVVYPFAGGDLSTALTVFPDADEITTLSLEPAGDPRALGRLTEKQVKAQLETVATELAALYRFNFSVTMHMIGAMRASELPTQLIFSLSALSIHGYEPIAMRYFKLTDAGDITYLTAADLKATDAIKDPGQRNRELANVEIRFVKKGSTREQVYRHIMANLADSHLKKTPGALVHLEKKGKVAAMTKAASYLLTFTQFVSMRKYLADHVEWMVSDSTGLPPSTGTPAGFEYETWGSYEASNMKEGASVTPSWRKLYAAQPARPLKFRFGYPDRTFHGHLIIMRRPKPELAKPAPPAPAPVAKPSPPAPPTKK